LIAVKTHIITANRETLLQAYHKHQILKIFLCISHPDCSKKS